MNKKTIIIILAIIVVIGGVYGVNRWRQQRLTNQILKDIYGVNTGGFLGNITNSGGSTISTKIAQELAKEAAKEKAEEAKEAAKTPEDKYKETKEMSTYDTNSKAIADDAKNIVEKVFGKAKLTSISTNVYSGYMTGSGAAEFKIARLATGNDLGVLSKLLTDKGLPTLQSGISNTTAEITAGNYESVIYSFTFEIGEQDVDVAIMKLSQ